MTSISSKSEYIRQYNAALGLAQRAHERQLDKAGMYYIMHLIRVSERCRTREAKIAALLHDLLEDTPLGTKDITRQGICNSIADAAAALMHRRSESYMDYIKRVGSNRIACEVKIADLEDNMDITRLNGDLTEEDFKRLQKYKKAWDYLMDLG